MKVSLDRARAALRARTPKKREGGRLIHFEEITEENFDAIIRMKRPENENLVAANAVSLAQAWLYREDGDVFSFAIYDDAEPVGFLLLEEDRAEEDLILWRIMFPPEHTGKGYGTQAVRLVLQNAAVRGCYRRVILDCDPQNHVARHVYEKLGFRPIGVIGYDSEELEAVLKKQ